MPRYRYTLGPRAYQIALEDENIVLFGTTQTEARRTIFKWVGPLSQKRDVLVARKDAKKVGRIGTLRDDKHNLINNYNISV